MFSERLKLARKRHGLSLRNLSSRLTGLVSAQAIGKYERGEMMPSSPVAIALAKALDVSVSYLLSPSVLSLQAVEFRKKAATKAREQAMVKAAVLD
ncbi:MAG: helix-turn-helix transcriptional regulator, partial [Synechococcus sp. SB0663_bin_10]|nr:helix-turn-helix transcriptional regulator [Synechococcus sp. SB0663_bin_10]